MLHKPDRFLIHSRIETMMSDFHKNTVMGTDYLDALRSLASKQESNASFYSWVRGQLKQKDIPPQVYFSLLAFADLIPEEKQMLVKEYIVHQAERVIARRPTDEDYHHCCAQFAIAVGYLIAEMREGFNENNPDV